MNNPPLRNFKKFIVGGISLIAICAFLLGGCGGRGSPSIKATPQTIQFKAAPTLLLHGSATVNATASSGLPVSYSSDTAQICSVNSATGSVTSLAVGVCVIAADQVGNDTFAPATKTTQSLTAAFDPKQTLTFATAPALTLYGTATVSASASSHLPVSYSSTTSGVCRVHASTGLVTNLTTGDCIIAANQAGNAHYNAAPQATQMLTIAAWVGALTVPSAPGNVSATLGNAADSVVVSFNGSSSSGGSPLTGYTVTSVPSGYSANGASSPISVACPTPCTGAAFTVTATNNIGTGAASPATDVLTNYNVTATFFEPDTQPNNTIFTGTFTFNSTTRTVNNLQGLLTESMTGPPMPTVPLLYQLSSVSDAAGGLLVSSFALNTPHTFAEGGFASGSPGLYYGYPTTPNPAAGGAGNSFITIYVNLSNPTTPLTAAQIQKLAYGDCASQGMMGDVCMTGHSSIGTMGGYPASQSISRQ